MNKTIFTIIKLLLILFVVCSIFSFEISSGKIDNEKILNLIITINGILIAVIATFLYSKILLERSERIEIKSEIDLLSLKLSSLRRIALSLLCSASFWIKPTNVIFHNYPGIDIFSLREFNYEQLREFLKKTNMGELNSQAFLGLHKLKGKDDAKLSINQNYRKNYSLQELCEYRECCSFLYSYCREFHRCISIEEYEANRINSYLIDINPSYKNLSTQEIGELFSNFSTKEIERLIQLTSQNTKPIGSVFNWIFLDIFISFVFLMISVLCFAYCDINRLLVNILVFGTIWIISDLILNTFYSLKNEIIINQFYK